MASSLLCWSLSRGPSAEFFRAQTGATGVYSDLEWGLITGAGSGGAWAELGGEVLSLQMASKCQLHWANQMCGL